MNRAVIVVGSHGAGKSKTINKFFKPLIDLSGRQRNFSNGRVLSQSIEEKFGQVFSQSLEEKGLESVLDFVRKYADLKYLVCAARPENENPSLLNELRDELERRGFTVSTINVIKDQPDSYYENKAQYILDSLKIELA